MGISSLGMGSSILTQDVLDQLRKADEASRITPIDLDLANEKDKKNALELIDASMKNLIDSINEIKSHSLYDERKTEVEGTSVEISADANTDLQEFTLEVTQLATKQIEESGSFDAKDAKIADDEGTMTLSIDGEDFDIEYDDTTTLDDLKKMINDTAGDKVNATIVQVADDDFRLFISSVETGENQDISITDNDGNLKDTKLTDDLDEIQTGVNAEFKFNSQEISRESNSFDDLVSGLNIELKEVGTSHVDVSQDREQIMERMDSFVEKYNDAISQLSEMTKSSADSKEKGIFSTESTIKNMKKAIESVIIQDEGAGSMLNLGFDVDKEGKLSLDKTVFNEQLDKDPKNVEAFLSGGTYTQDDDSTIELQGAFTLIASKVEEYTKYDAILDRFSNSINDQLSVLEDRKTAAIERLDNKYEIMKKQFASYDLMINKLNSASSMFIEMANAQTAAQD